MKTILSPVRATAPPSAKLQDFTAIYDLYLKAIERYCMGKCRDLETSQDLAQETFLRFWICLQRKEDVRQARAFLYRIAHNLFIDHVRRKKEASLDEMLEDGFEPSTDPWNQLRSKLDAESLLAKLEQSQDQFRELVTLRFMKGLAPVEIAAMTGETPNVVSVRIFRSLKLLRTLA